MGSEETDTGGRAVLRTLLTRAAGLVQAWRKLLGEPYRPEKHYMRGPGPKWREKHGPVHSG
jgi:hypothetical protein